MHQLEGIKETIRHEESRCAELIEANNVKIEEVSKLTQEVAQLQTLKQDLECMMPLEGINDGPVSIDVGGRIFKTYRSTLTQFENSVLAVMVSSKWSEGIQQSDGSFFLDMDPDVFDEILSFLRARRVRPSTRSSFSKDAADLAEYLGLPVHHMKGMRELTASYRRVGDKRGNNLAFSIRLREPGRVKIRSLSFSVQESCKCIVFTKPGRYDDALATC